MGEHGIVGGRVGPSRPDCEPKENGGSSGYGREYRERLHMQWGVMDVEDCTNAAKYLAENNLADPARAAITGGSAGGYTTLCALTFADYFKIGGSHYGVGDLETLASDTNKFESHYLDWLVGKYPEEPKPTSIVRPFMPLIG